MTDTVHQVPLAQIRESQLNRRQRFDPVKLAELAESLKAHGVITPAVARQVPIVKAANGEEADAAPAKSKAKKKAKAKA